MAAECIVCNTKCPARESSNTQWWQYAYCSVKCRDKKWKERADRIVRFLDKCPDDVAVQLASAMIGEVEEVQEMAGNLWLDKRRKESPPKATGLSGE